MKQALAADMPQSTHQHAIGKLRLPHPHLTTYYVFPAGTSTAGQQLLQVRREQNDAPPQQDNEIKLDADFLFFSDPEPTPAKSIPAASSNTSWARARRAPLTNISWEGSQAPNQGQLWLLLYGIFTVHPELESFRATLSGTGNGDVVAMAFRSMLAVEHPAVLPDVDAEATPNEILFLRSAFWQGAGSPFGSSPPWAPCSGSSRGIEPMDYSLTTKFPDARVHIRHPRRAPKPRPGSVVYSCYIPSLDNMFSLVALDYENEEHLNLFHKWQNDPRVAAGWNETGTLDEHREYLRKQHEDSHTFTVLGRFDDTFFSYFELFWGKEDHVGAHYEAGDFDRGRHIIVGDGAFRGKHRVLAWWPALIHYLFLDDSRTNWVIGEPNVNSTKILAYDYMCGLNVEKLIDFPHKRSALVKVSRERFFQMSHVFHGGQIAGTGVPIAKL